jgi:hypothetical protein
VVGEASDTRASARVVKVSVFPEPAVGVAVNVGVCEAVRAEVGVCVGVEVLVAVAVGKTAVVVWITS